MSAVVEVATICANCAQPTKDHDEDVCLVAALCGVLRDRGVEDVKLEKIMATVDTEALWEAIGPILDGLEDGEFTSDEQGEEE